MNCKKKKKKTFYKARLRIKWPHWWILPNTERINTNLLKTLQKKKKEKRKNRGKTALNISEANNNLILKPDKYITRKLHTNLWKSRCNNSQQNTSKQNPVTFVYNRGKWLYTMTSEIVAVMQSWFNKTKINVKYYINKKPHYTFNRCTKTTCQITNSRISLIQKKHLWKSHNIIFDGERLKAFPTRSGIRQGCLLLPHIATWCCTF